MSAAPSPPLRNRSVLRRHAPTRQRGEMRDLRRPEPDKRDRTSVVIALADAQHGRISARQLAELGLSRDAVASRVRAGWLVAEHRGVYRLAGVAPSLAGRCTAAVLAVDPTAGITDRSGLELHEVLEPRAGTPVHLACATRHRARPGIVVHPRALGRGDSLRVLGLRVASVTRCLVDLAATADAAMLAKAVHEAEFRRVLDPSALQAAAVGRRGGERLRTLAAQRLPIRGDLRLELERRFAQFLRDYGFPVALVNHRLILERPWQEIFLDAVWLAAGLAVELDGRQAHATARAFDDDRERDRRVSVQHDIDVVRVTWRHLAEEQDRLAHDLWTLYHRGVAARTTGPAPGR